MVSGDAKFYLLSGGKRTDLRISLAILSDTPHTHRPAGHYAEANTVRHTGFDGEIRSRARMVTPVPDR